MLLWASGEELQDGGAGSEALELEEVGSAAGTWERGLADAVAGQHLNETARVPAGT